VSVVSCQCQCQCQLQVSVVGSICKRCSRTVSVSRNDMGGTARASACDLPFVLRLRGDWLAVWGDRFLILPLRFLTDFEDEDDWGTIASKSKESTRTKFSLFRSFAFRAIEQLFSVFNRPRTRARARTRFLS
jgi:hypothetical protein